MRIDRDVMHDMCCTVQSIQLQRIKASQELHPTLPEPSSKIRTLPESHSTPLKHPEKVWQIRNLIHIPP